MSNSQALVGKDHRISIRETEDSTLPPILNAVEIYMVKQKEELLTYSEDGKQFYFNLHLCLFRHLGFLISSKFVKLLVYLKKKKKKEE